MAHSWIMYFENEYEAFKKYAMKYPDATVLLIDTYDVLDSGLPNAIRCAKEVLEPMGKRLKGVRIDSGDLAYLSKKVRKVLDEAGLTDCIVVASNSLDEYTVSSLIGQGAKIDSFGIGERLVTAKSEPVFGAVYKLGSVEKDGVIIPKIKVSETVEKITNPGRKKVYRVYNEEGIVEADLIAKDDETVDLSKPYRYIDPIKPWKRRKFVGFSAKELLELVIKEGKRVSPKRSLNEIREYVINQLNNEIWEEEQRFENPHIHYLDMTPAYYEMKMDMLDEVNSQNDES